MKGKTEGVRKLWEKYRFAALVMLIGAGLLLWPSGRSAPGVDAVPTTDSTKIQDLETEMAEILGVMSGVGEVRVLLTLESDGERKLAQDTELRYSGNVAAPEDYSRRSETVLVDGQNGDDAVVTRTIYPTYRGALIVCRGGDRAEVKLAVTEAVTALTGLSADRVTVAKWQ